MSDQINFGIIPTISKDDSNINKDLKDTRKSEKKKNLLQISRKFLSGLSQRVSRRFSSFFAKLGLKNLKCDKSGKYFVLYCITGYQKNPDKHLKHLEELNRESNWGP